MNPQQQAIAQITRQVLPGYIGAQTWVILTCRPRMEFRARDEIHGLGLSALVPVEFKLRQMAKAITRIKRPVLPGYVFAALPTADDWHAIGGIDGVRLPLRLDGRWATLTAAQVRALEVLSQPAEQSRNEGSAHRIGDRIRIRRGAMAELEAVVASVAGGNIVAIVDLFGKQHQVTVPAEQVEAA